MSLRLILIVLALLTPGWSWALCVTANKATLRAGPGGHHPETWVVGKFTPLVEIEKKNGWFKVKDQDGQIHWVSGYAVSKKESCLAIRSSVAKLRTGPSSKNPVVEGVITDKYTAFRNLDHDGEWYMVQNQFGEKFWVHQSNVWRPTRVLGVGF